MSRTVCTMSPKPRTARRGAGRTAAEARAVGRIDQPQHQRQIEHGVEHDAGRRPERQQDGGADRRAGQHGEIARHGVEPHRALQIRRADDIVEQHLVRRLPQHPGAAVNHQDHHGLPHLQGAGDEEIAPAQRCGDEQRHADLDDPARVEAIGERAGGHREQQERQPVRHDGESRQGRRVEFLIQHPVADDVLDIVRHHGEHESDELGAEARVPHRRKGPPAGWRGAGGDRSRVTHQEPSLCCAVQEPHPAP